jgi:4-hydroxybenzoate polyprenyltransferase
MPEYALDIPLVIDLDGTLVATDSLYETLLNVLRSNPLLLWRLPLRFVAGRAAIKDYLAGKSPLNVETWPAREDFVGYVEKQAAAGRPIVLATAADQSVADAMASRFPFISEVIASDGTSNMKGKAKADRLCQRFPEGFIYAGNSDSDLQVWQRSRHSILVNTPSHVARRARRLGQPLAEFPRRQLSFNVLRRSLRLHQWAKNALVFVPLLLGGKASDLTVWITSALGFTALGFAASATYVINDLWDLPSDRRHWSKRLRPLASGDLSIQSGLLMAFAGLVVAFAIAAWLGIAEAAIVALYVCATLSYSFFLKRVPILDVFTLASLFTLRLGFGIVLTHVRLSPWLLVFSMFVFLSLSMAKRHTEVLRLAERGLEATEGRGYLASDAPLTLGLGLASMLGGVVILILYLIEDAFPRGFYSDPVWLWATPSILFLFLGRIWLLCQRGQLRDDPVAFALKDRISVGLGALMAASFAAALLKLGHV